MSLIENKAVAMRSFEEVWNQRNVDAIDNMRAKLTALEETRETARRELEALDRHQEKLEELERDRDALLDSLVAVAPDAVDALMPEERLQVYKMLGLRVDVGSKGDIEVSGTLGDDLSVCTPRAARA
jgi:DNA repair exonuclease SbcCD ATPase subunit